MLTTQEIRHKFNLHYDNINSGGAPGLNTYEISLFLTQAFREIIYNSYSGNVKGDSVDDSEKVKSLLSGITKSIVLTDDKLEGLIDPIAKDFTYTKVYLPEEVWYILKENVKINGNTILVKALTHNEFWLAMENPFKTPNNFKAWRVDEYFEQDLEADEDTTIPLHRQLLLVTHATVTSYGCTFIEKQIPIILSDLTGTLTIEGKNKISLPKVISKNPWLADLVVNRAVELATRDYKMNTLETQLGLNARVE